MARRSTCSVEIHKVDLIIGRVETRLQGFTAAPNRLDPSDIQKFLENLKTHFGDQAWKINLYEGHDYNEGSEWNTPIAIVAFGQY